MPIRPFRFGVQAKSAATRPEWVELARRVEGARVLDARPARPLRRPARPGAGAAVRRRRHLDAAARRARPRQRLQAPGGARQGTGHDGRALRRPRPDRARRRMDGDRLRAVGHPVRPARRTHQPHDRGPVDHPVGARPPSRSRSPASTTRSRTTTALPKPVQSPMPVLIGGGGPRVLRFAAREADIVGDQRHADVGRHRRSDVRLDDGRGGRREGRRRARRRGRRRPARRDRVERPHLHGRSSPTTSDSALQTLADFTGRRDRDDRARRRSPLVGPPGKLVDDLLERRQRWGFSYVIVGQNDVESFAPVVAAPAGAGTTHDAVSGRGGGPSRRRRCRRR